MNTKASFYGLTLQSVTVSEGPCCSGRGHIAVGGVTLQWEGHIAVGGVMCSVVNYRRVLRR